ncbi:MAG: hypothetical protein ACOC9T_01390 [Myxococcota bacterium]
MTATARIVRPAQVPVRSFSAVWIATGHLPEETRLAQELVRHLERADSVDVKRVDVEDLEPARVAGRIPPETVVLLLDVGFEEDVRREWSTRPENVCGPYGCYTQQRSYDYLVPEVRGVLTVSMYEGPSARLLRKVSLDAQDEGRSHDVLRRRVLGELVEQARAAVDQRVEPVRVTLREVELPLVDEALQAIRRGAWRRGRVLLERAARSGAAATLAPEQRARLWYDLGQARRFDPRALEEPDRHFELARAAFEKAIDLQPAPLYRSALADLARHRAQVERVREQQAAAARRGQGSREPSDDVPDPPPSYAR